MKTLSAPVLAALAGGSVAIATLIKLDFAGTPVYLNTSTWDLTWQRRYNLLASSQQIDAAPWGHNGCFTSVTADAATAPDGTVTAELMVRNAAASGNWAALTQNSSVGVGFNVGKTYTGSVWLWTPSGTLSIGLVISDANYNTIGGTFISVTTTPTRYTFTTSGPGGGWNPAGSNIGFGLNAAPGSFYMWGAQLEVGELASTYTPTTTAALTDTGVVYKGAYGLGQISAIADKPGEAAGITLELHGADAARISLALDDADIVQGTPCTIRTAIIDTATYTILDAPVEWVGKLDTMAIGEDGASATIAVTAESGAVDLLRGNVWTFTDADQRIVNASDASFSYVLDQIDKPIIWPTKAFFYK